MGRQIQAGLRVVGIMTIAATLLLCAVYLPQAARSGWGEALAILSASLMQPQQGMEVLTKEWERAPAGASSASTSTVAPPQNETESTTSPSVSDASVPPKGDGGGTVYEEQIGGGTALASGIYAKNNSGVERDFSAYVGQSAGIAFTDTVLPQVLIVHTHTSEAYMTYYAGYYNAGDTARTTDTQTNVCAVGEALAERLRAHGIAVIHDVTVHDSPQYTGAYERSAATVQSILAEYPSIRLVLDLHRDAIQREDTVKIKPTVTVAGQKAAQMMLVVGTVDDEDISNPYWETNVRLALQLQQRLNGTCEGLMRPISFTASRYNQQLFAGSLLVEVGGDVNTVPEAIYAAELLGDAIAAELGT